ncbi:MAG: ACT domain-containing protein [Anaerolineales bacterium]|nr:ACT domain-containing protein [Anaerolineales bacterium]
MKGGGEKDLATLLREMRPFLHPQAVVFFSFAKETFFSLDLHQIASFWEEEGITVVLPQSQAEQLNLPIKGYWAWITLQIHSSLEAVGFLAVITSAFAKAGISANVFSAFYHDHIFVPWERRLQAMEVLRTISKVPNNH